jgi:hypothetical protein
VRVYPETGDIFYIFQLSNLYKNLNFSNGRKNIKVGGGSRDVAKSALGLKGLKKRYNTKSGSFVSLSGFDSSGQGKGIGTFTRFTIPQQDLQAKNTIPIDKWTYPII